MLSRPPSNTSEQEKKIAHLSVVVTRDGTLSSKKTNKNVPSLDSCGLRRRRMKRRRVGAMQMQCRV